MNQTNVLLACPTLAGANKISFTIKLHDWPNKSMSKLMPLAPRTFHQKPGQCEAALDGFVCFFSGTK